MAKELKIRITGDASELEGVTEKAGGTLGKFATAAGAAGLAVGAAFVGAGVGLFKIGESFDQAYDTIRLGTGATGDALQDLQADFKAVFAATPASMEDASSAIADLNTALGLTGKPLQDLSVQMLALSKVTGDDIGSSVASATRFFGDWGIATEDQAGALDRLWKTSQATGSSVSTLADLSVQAGAPMRSLGFTFEETTALIGKWNKEGVNTETVMGALKAANGKFAKEFGEQAPAAFRKFMEEIKQAPSATAGAAVAIDKLGVEAGPDFAAAVREGRFEIDDLMASIAGSDETVLGAAKATESFGEKWAMIKNRVLVGLEPLAMKVFDGMGKAMDRLAPFVERIIGLFQAGEWQAALGEVGKKIVDAFRVAGDWLSNTGLPLLGSALEALGRKFGTWVTETAVPYLQENLPIWLSALGDWITGTALPWLGEQALALAGILGGWIADAAGFLVANLPGWLSSFAGWVTGTALPWLDEQALAMAHKLGDWIADAARFLIANLPGWLGDFTRWAVGTALPTMITTVARFALAMAEWVADAIIGLAKRLPGWVIAFNLWVINDALPAAVRFGAQLLGKLLEGVSGASDFLWNTGVEVVRGLIGGILSMGPKLASSVSGLIQNNIPGPVRSILGISSPSRVMMELGLQTGAGLALGIDASRAQVAGAAGRLGASAFTETSFAARPTYSAIELSGGQRWRDRETPVIVQIDGRTVASTVTPYQREMARRRA